MVEVVIGALEIYDDDDDDDVDHEADRNFTTAG